MKARYVRDGVHIQKLRQEKMKMREKKRSRGGRQSAGRMSRRTGGGYVFGFGAGNKLVCCRQKRGGQVEFSSDGAPQCTSPHAENIKDIK